MFQGQFAQFGGAWDRCIALLCFLEKGRPARPPFPWFLESQEISADPARSARHSASHKKSMFFRRAKLSRPPLQVQPSFRKQDLFLSVRSIRSADPQWELQPAYSWP